MCIYLADNQKLRFKDSWHPGFPKKSQAANFFGEIQRLSITLVVQANQYRSPVKYLPG